MKRFTTIFMLLLMMCVGAWATPVNVTVIDKALDATTYGTLANGTFTTNAASGMADVTISGIISTTATSFPYGACLGLTNTASGTITMTAPEGYFIIGYTLTARSNTYSVSYTLTPSAGGNAVTTSTGGVTLSTWGLDAQTASFTYSASSANSFYIPSMVITIGTAEDVAFAKSQVEAYNTVQGWIPTAQGAKGLVKDASNYISNAKSSAEGSYEALLDGEYTTYFHGAYGSEGPDEDQYLQATLSKAVDAIYFYYKKRSQNNNNRPTSITISGSNDGSTFTNITTISSGLPTDGSVLDYTSSKISLGASYQYLRFTVTATNNGSTNSSGHVFFTFSEFYILPSDTEVDDVMDLRAALAGTAAVNYTAQNISDVTAANTALLSTVVDVTYALYESDGTTFVSNTVVEQEKNSAVSIPSAISNYTYYDYATEGTIGTTDCTIKVIRTLKAGYVISLDGLSNSKCYNIRNNRATWAVGSGATVVNSTSELGLAFLASDTKQQFAFITYEGNVYLYSVGEGKFAYVDGTKLSLTANVTDAVLASPVTFQASTNATYMYSEPIVVTVGGDNFGVSTGFSPDIYKYTPHPEDGGNCVYIIEAGSFDATAPLALLEEYIHPTNCYDRFEAAVLPFLQDGSGNLSPTIGKPFGLSSEAASSIVTTYMTQLNNQQLTLAEYEAILAAKNAGIIYPTSGKFYLVKNNYNGKYMRVTASGTHGTVLADLTAEEAAKDVSAHFCFTENNSHLYMTTQGEYLNWVWGRTNGYEGYTSTNFDKYVHFVNTAPGVGAFSIAYGNGEGDYAGYLGAGFYALKDTETKVVAGSPTDQTHEMAQWTFEEVSTLGITLNGPVDGKYYATLCLPFNVTALEDATAYTLAMAPDGKTLNMTATATIAAGTPVLLEGTTTSATATISTAASSTISTETALTGQYFAAAFDGVTNYTLGTDGTKVGFFHWNGTTLGANRAYVAGSGSTAKGFYLNFETDGIEGMEITNDIMTGKVYNLAGQQVTSGKLQRGLYIINGKKVVIK